jgi:hypothetical protein
MACGAGSPSKLDKVFRSLVRYIHRVFVERHRDDEKLTLNLPRPAVQFMFRLGSPPARTYPKPRGSHDDP